MSKEQTTNTASDKRINSRLQETPIAIVGMASVFAESKNLGQFWDMIVNSVNGIQDVPEDRWAIDDYYSEDKKAADKSYCKRGGFLPEIDFDPMEFGLPPNLLELTDITQLMALVVARDVLADAGVSEESSFDRDKMGITLGVGGGQKQGGQLMSRLQGPVLEKVLKASGLSDNDTDVIVEKFKKAYIPWEENSFPGMLGNVIAGRIANRFNFGGTNCVVDAACAGSLAAIKMAVSDLLEYRSDMMISGGICCDNSPFMYMSFSKTPAFTDGDCIRPFDEKSNGMMIGEGVGMIALKRLEDAERDGDRIYSVIKGIGSSSDGKFKSIYAPRPEGQLKALKRAYDDAGFDPKTCGLIEAHGTGTKAGDAAEFRGLELLFSENNDQKQHVALGSVKSQVGHTKAAAGTAGLIKAALALHHKVLPATINVDKPNKNLNIENTPLYINTETRPWMQRADGAKRQAGISSFGFGGTNFHFVLEEYTQAQRGAYRLNDVAQSFLLSADNKAELIKILNENLNLLNVDVEFQPYAFNKMVLSYPVQKIAQSQVRCGFVAHDANEAIKLIQDIIKQLMANESKEWSQSTGIFYREQGIKTTGKVVALFSGQGSQYVNMGRELVCHFPSMMSTQVAMDQQFHQAGKASLSNIVYPIPVFDAEKRSQQELNLRLTQFAQPAIGGLSVGLFNTFKQAGFKADFCAGHSFGELTALWAAGVFSEVDYMKLTIARGQAMSTPENTDIDAGKMAAVIGHADEVETLISSIENVSIANYNAHNQVVIAGTTDAIKAASVTLNTNGFKVIELPVSAAFHTPLVGHAQKPFAQAIDEVTFNKPTTAVYSNATGKAYNNNPEEIKAELKKHILQSVQFSEEISQLYNAGGRIFVEFGPKNVLTRLVHNILSDKNDVFTIATNSNAKKSSDLQLRLAALELAVMGLELDGIDPYSAVARPTVAPKKSPLAMKLSGASYVSPKTKKAFEDALTDDWKISNAHSSSSTVKEVVVEKVVEKVVYVDNTGKPLANQPAQTPTAQQNLASNIENNIELFIKHQSDLLAVHQAYLDGPNQYAETFQSVLAAQAGQQKLPEGLDKTLAMYHDFQTETLRVHETYLNNQTNNMQQMFAHSSDNQVANLTSNAHSQTPQNQSAQLNTAKVTSAHQNTVKQTAVKSNDLQAQLQATHQTIQSAKAVVENQHPITQINLHEIENKMLTVVAEKTGYPTEMLELSMDMEADLGIDSIKRVEILGAVQDNIPNLPELDAEQLSQMRTLAEIVTYMNEVVSSVSVSLPQVSTIAVKNHITDSQEIEQTMLAVVAEKTGYPTEMLELSMDMEADLGIDSIKRVEILGAVQDDIPNLPELDAEQLSQMRTLAEIVTYMNEVVSSVSVSLPQVSTIAVKNHITDSQEIEQTMLAVVAEKTGYPAEMLELSMDMEADLGIDSIKRVEILGAVQDEITDLPELDAEQLSQMRTLAEIVTYMNEVAASFIHAVVSSAPILTETVTAITQAIDIQLIERTMFAVVAKKTGYPTEMLELSMDMEADLGIDSIKRVEILGAVQDEITDLPELDAEQLSQMRTLAEIVTYMNEVMSSISVAAPQLLEESALPNSISNNVIANKTIDAKLIEQTMLTVVADKTGYPTEMLELSMDMEADLGIDSIKRVEILGAVQDEITDLPELDAEQLSQMRTLAEIVTYMNEVMSSVSVALPQLLEESPLSNSISNNVIANKTIDAKLIEQTMLAVVADKTGYPTEMLELSMDMEADLGIDSIKRVEILGAVQDEITDLPELDAEQLSQMRTLAEIVTYMNEVMSSVSVALPQLLEESPLSNSISNNVIANKTIDAKLIEQTMLAVVADKTGYPTEMLELSMDMEADLGIDSIKRVEILGAVQDEIIDLPELDAEQLSQIRTLAEIVTYMNEVNNDSSASVVRFNVSKTIDKKELDESLLVSTEIENIIAFTPSPSATVQIKQLAALECMDSRVVNKNMLLVNDGQGSCVYIANNLSQLGWNVVVITPSWIESATTKVFNKEVTNLPLDEVTEAALSVVLESKEQWQSVIYLHPKSEVLGIHFESKYKKGLQLAFLLAKLSKLNQVNNETRSSFVVLTRQGGDFSTNKIEKKADLVQGGLAGLVKTLAHEWDNVFCRILDIPSQYAAEKVTNIVINELNDKQTKPVEVGFNSKGRLTLVAKSTDSYTLESSHSIDQDSVFLVSGGAKGVTAHCVIEIAKQYQCKFLLLGRSAYQAQEETWSLEHETEESLKKAAMQFLIAEGEKPNPKLIQNMVNPVLANREISQTLNRISDEGGIAEYVSADVCDAYNLKQAIEPICELWGAITGIIHGAGVLADKYIEQKTLLEFDQVYNTKVNGLQAMLACCVPERLEHLVVFSSAAGFYGNPGQSDYAIANEILNKAAYRFKFLYPETQVLSFNWGPWDGGMVTPALKRMFDERGVYIIPIQSGATLLVRELASNTNRCVQIVVGTDMSGNDKTTEDDSTPVISKPLSSSVVKVFNTDNSSLLRDHQIDGFQVLPTVCSIAWMKSVCEELYPEYKYQGIEEFKLFKGIVFDGNQAKQFLIETKLVEDSESSICVDVVISSEKEKGKTFFHFRGLVNLSKQKSEMLVYQDALPTLIKKDSEEALALYHDGSLFHGKNFQGIKQIHQMDESGILLECVIDQSVLRSQGEFLLVDNNVLANDLVYQALLIWTSKFIGEGSLPSSTDAWQVFREVNINEYFFVKLTITKTVGQRVIGNILLIDKDGNIISKVTSAEVTCSATLKALFKANA
ncbi:SDR family NAD(P)-dependent oxidoreductase [Psychromonas sp. RZ22]|uniref:type I polyketide synthase n=1 Tax=Psychromonas algarum TaxID=2555643 RepID=UPI0010685DE6|nr:type I polyketide synthase [Psychromonas sp. RZ22]TEW55938.1 SDR family NAD(P)-dependent oxidoreductase [Psychromonas sp. RZ22]